MSALTNDGQRKSLDTLVKGLQGRRFFGKVELDMAGGNILRVLLHESIKLKETSDEQQSDSQEQPSSQQDQETTAKA